MHIEKAHKLRKDWGSRPCIHPDIEKEYHLGMETGEKVCTLCGRIVHPYSGKKNPLKYFPVK